MLKLRDLPFGIYEKSISPHLSWEEKFKLIKDSGYDYFEIAIDATPPRLALLESREEQLKIRRASESLDTPLYTMAFTANRFFPLGSENDKIRTEGIRLCKRAVDFASFVGATVVNIAAYDEYEKPRNPNTEANFMESLKQCVDHAAKRAVIVSLESLDSTFVDCTKKVLQFVRAIGSPWLQISADPGNITAMGHNPVTDIPLGSSHLVKVEFKDTKPGVVRNVVFGEGIVDFSACFKMLNEIGFQGVMTAEMWWHEDVKKQPDIIHAREFLKEKMANY